MLIYFWNHSAIALEDKTDQNKFIFVTIGVIISTKLGDQRTLN